MPVHTGETLPVATADLVRRKQIEEDILQEIEDSMASTEGMPSDGIDELEQQKTITVRSIGWLATEITSRQ